MIRAAVSSIEPVNWTNCLENEPEPWVKAGDIAETTDNKDTDKKESSVKNLYLDTSNKSI